MSTSEEDRFAAVRTQTAVVRTVADELRRRNASQDPASGLQGQVIEESARLVSVMTDPARVSTRPRADAGLAQDGKHPRPAPSGARRRMLIVDDEPATRAALVRWSSATTTSPSLAMETRASPLPRASPRHHCYGRVDAKSRRSLDGPPD